MENIKIKYFEVKTGENKGFYIGIEGATKEEQLKLLRDNGINLGILDSFYNFGFYRRHSISEKNGLIWTHSCYAGNEYNRRLFKEYISILENLGYKVIQ